MGFTNSNKQCSVDKGGHQKEKVTANLIYGLSRYEEDYSPMSLYIPNKPLLFKMMKACVGVNRIEELWIY